LTYEFSFFERYFFAFSSSSKNPRKAINFLSQNQVSASGT